MKKAYSLPALQIRTFGTVAPLALSGNTGEGNNPIVSGDDDTEGDGDPDSKQRGGFDGWGDLW